MKEPSRIILRARIAILAAISIVLLITVVMQYRVVPKPQKSTTFKSKIDLLKSNALAANVYDTKGLVPGDPDEAEIKLKEFGRCVAIFLKAHPDAFKSAKIGNIRLVSIANLMFPDMVKNMSAYNLPEGLSPFEYFSNPDIKYSPTWGPNLTSGADLSHIVTFSSRLLRPDGSLIGSPKPKNTRDVYAYWDVYVHDNFVANAEDMMKSTTNPIGFYLVLWEDGSVARVPFDQIMYAPSASEANSYSIAFVGQAGVPANSISYVEDYMKHHRGMKPKTGKPGILGYAMDGTEVKNP